MKTAKFEKKLVLNKNTVATLEHSEQAAIKGGYYYTKMYGGAYCRTWHPVCPTRPIAQCGPEY